jgi:hypothetical protein
MIRKIAAAAAITVAGALSLGSQAAHAAAGPAQTASAAATAVPSSIQARAWVAQQVRNLLKYNHGARQISFNAVRYKGAILGVTIPRQAASAGPDSISGLCPNTYVCLFENVNFNTIEGGGQRGSWIGFNQCGVNFNLYNYYMAEGGGSWANQASSIDYPGTATSAEAKFNHDGNWWLYLYRDHYLRNLTLNGGPSPHHNSNDWITGLYAC